MATTTSNTYVGDGSAVLFSFTFPYINEDDIYITLDGILTTEYTLANATTIEFNAAPASGAAIRIFRLTDIEEVSATFFPGSAIRAQDLNSNFEQTLYVAQELQGNTLLPDGSVPMVGNLDLGGFNVVNGGAQFNKTVDLANNRVTNVAAPVDSTDAANRAYVDNRTGGNTEIVSTSYVYYTATQGDTVLTSNVSGVPVFAVSEGLEQIYVNGALQQTNVDYTTQSSSQITFAQPLLQDDVVAIHCINNIPLSTTTDADEVEYTYPGGVQQTVQARLEQYVSIKDFGAVGDGVTDDKSAIQLALNTGKDVFIPVGTYYVGSDIGLTAENQTLFGSGNGSVIFTAAGVSISTSNHDYVTLRDFKLECTPGAPIAPGVKIYGSGGAIRNVYFLNGPQRCVFYTADHWLIDGCTFDGTGYGILQQSPYPSSFVTVNGCIGRRMYGDMIELNVNANESTPADVPPSRNWIISNNQFTGNLQFPAFGTEDRFVGITEVENVIITGNNVEYCAGDSAIHLEDLRGETVISNNILMNNLASNGNQGIIYLLNSAENTIIEGNIIGSTDRLLANEYMAALSVAKSSYTNNLVISNNRIFCTQPSNPPFQSNSRLILRGLILSNQNSESAATITGNDFDGLDRAFVTSSANNLNIVGNTFSDCNEIIWSDDTAFGSNCAFSENICLRTTAAYDFYHNAGATLNGLKQLRIQNNTFQKGVSIIGTGAAGGGGENRSVIVSGNAFYEGSTVSITGTHKGFLVTNNQFDNGIDPANSLTRSNFLDISDGLAFSGLSLKQATNVSGDFTVNITNMTGAASQWRPMSFLLIYNGVLANGGGAFKNIAWVTTRSNTSSSTAAGGVIVTDIVGTSSIVTTSTSVSNIQFDVTVTAGARSNVTVLQLGNAPSGYNISDQPSISIS